MALINCPECGRRVSDKAAACPGCGYPIAGTEVAGGGTRKNEDNEENCYTAEQIENESFVRALPAVLCLGSSLGEYCEGDVWVWGGTAQSYKHEDKVELMDGGIMAGDRLVSYKQMRDVRCTTKKSYDIKVSPGGYGAAGATIGNVAVMSGRQYPETYKEVLTGLYKLIIEYVDIDTRENSTITLSTLSDPSYMARRIKEAMEGKGPSASGGRIILNIASSPLDKYGWAELDDDRIAQAIPLVGKYLVELKVKELGHDYSADFEVKYVIMKHNITCDEPLYARVAKSLMADPTERKRERSIKLATAAAVTVLLIILFWL